MSRVTTLVRAEEHRRYLDEALLLKASILRMPLEEAIQKGKLPLSVIKTVNEHVREYVRRKQKAEGVPRKHLARVLGLQLSAIKSLVEQEKYDAGLKNKWAPEQHDRLLEDFELADEKLPKGVRLSELEMELGFRKNKDGDVWIPMFVWCKGVVVDNRG
jgi:hypothetical protein